MVSCGAAVTGAPLTGAARDDPSHARRAARQQLPDAAKRAHAGIVIDTFSPVSGAGPIEARSSDRFAAHRAALGWRHGRGSCVTHGAAGGGGARRTHRGAADRLRHLRPRWYALVDRAAARGRDRSSRAAYAAHNGARRTHRCARGAADGGGARRTHRGTADCVRHARPRRKTLADRAASCGHDRALTLAVARHMPRTAVNAATMAAARGDRGGRGGIAALLVAVTATEVLVSPLMAQDLYRAPVVCAGAARHRSRRSRPAVAAACTMGPFLASRSAVGPYLHKKLELFAKSELTRRYPPFFSIYIFLKV